MPLDPLIKIVLDQIEALGLPPHYEVGAVQARVNAASRPRAQGPDVTSVENRSIHGPDGQVPIRIYTPNGLGPFPAIVWAHGGGMVIGTLETCDYICRHLCVNVGCVAVSVDYRLAPEHPFPAAIEDAMAHPGPAIIDFRVEPEENVYPHVPAGESVAEMLEGPIAEERIWQR